MGLRPFSSPYQPRLHSLIRWSLRPSSGAFNRATPGRS